MADISFVFTLLALSANTTADPCLLLKRVHLTNNLFGLIKAASKALPFTLY